MRAVLRDLERTKQRYLQEDLDIYFDDITDAAERIWDVLENYKEVAEALEDSNESVLSHRLNESLRVLTAFSVAMLPLTLLASVFGMNVPLPGQPGSPAEFWVIVALMAAILSACCCSSAAAATSSERGSARAGRRWSTTPPLERAHADRASAVYGSLLVTALVAAQATERRRAATFIAATLRRRRRRVLADRGLDGAHRDPDARPDHPRRGRWRSRAPSCRC